MNTTLNKGKELVFAFFFLSLLTQPAFAEISYSKKLTGEEFEMGILLEWSTNQEVNSQLFIVERSSDGNYFKEIGTIEAAGFINAELDYRFLDVNAEGAKPFYRLKEIYKDGSSSFSHTIVVSKQMPNRLKVMNISSSEVQKELAINIHCREATTIYYTLSTQLGDLVLASSFLTRAGSNELVIPMGQYPEGVYKIVLQEGKEKDMLVVRKVGKPFHAESVAAARQVNIN